MNGSLAWYLLPMLPYAGTRILYVYVHIYRLLMPSFQPNGLFRGEIATLAHSLPLSLSAPPTRWSKMSQPLPLLLRFSSSCSNYHFLRDDNFLSAATAGSVTAAQLETSSVSFPRFLRIFDRATLTASERRDDTAGSWANLRKPRWYPRLGDEWRSPRCYRRQH